MLIKKQIKRICLRWQTLLAVLIGLLVVVIQALTINQVNATRGVNNAFLHLTGFDFSGSGTTIYYLILPLMCGLAASSTYQEDKRNHRLSQLLSRRTQRQYLFSTTASSFIVGGLVGILPLLVEAGYFFINFQVTNAPTGRDYQIISPAGWGYNLFIHNTLLFWLCTILITFVFSGLFSLMGLVSSYFEIHSGVETIIPFVISFITLLAANLTGEVETSLYYVLTPTYSNGYSYTQWVLLGYLLVILLAVFGLTWRQSKQDVFN